MLGSRAGYNCRTERGRTQRPAGTHQWIAGDEVGRTVTRRGEMPPSLDLQTGVGDLRLEGARIVRPGRELVPAPQDTGLGNPRWQLKGQHDLLATVVRTQLPDALDHQMPHATAGHRPAIAHGHRCVLQLSDGQGVHQVAVPTRPNQPCPLGYVRQVDLGALGPDRRRRPGARRRHGVDPHMRVRHAAPAQRGLPVDGGDRQITYQRRAWRHRNRDPRAGGPGGLPVHIPIFDIHPVAVGDTGLDSRVDILAGARPDPTHGDQHRRRLVHGPIDCDGVHGAVQPPRQPHIGTGLLRMQARYIPHHHDTGRTHRYRPPAAHDRRHLVTNQHPSRGSGIGQLGGPSRTQAAFNRRCSPRAARLPHQPDHPVGHRPKRRGRGPPAQHHGTVLAARGQLGWRREWQRRQCGQRRPAVSHGREHRGQRVLLLGWRQCPRRVDPAADDLLVGGELGKHLIRGTPVRTGHIGCLGDEPAGPVGSGVLAAGFAVLDQCPPPGVGSGQRGPQPRVEILGRAGCLPTHRHEHRARFSQQLTGVLGMAVLQVPTDRGEGISCLAGLAQTVPAEPARRRGGLGRPAARRTRGVELGVAITTDA